MGGGSGEGRGDVVELEGMRRDGREAMEWKRERRILFAVGGCPSRLVELACPGRGRLRDFLLASIEPVRVEQGTSSLSLRSLAGRSLISHRNHIAISIS